MLECPNRLETLAIDTPANKRMDACVCRNPCIVMVGIFTCLQCLSKTEFAVELYTAHLTKIGESLEQ